MLDPGFDDYVAMETADLRTEPSEQSELEGHLLWGDGVRRLAPGTIDGWVSVRGRGRTGWVQQAALGGQSLLEVYFIDVGQGDGILIKTPDFRHIMIDGGLPRRNQTTGKSAADFVDWKFAKDYGSDRIALDALIASHNDHDHFGGLTDLFERGDVREFDTETLTVEAVYHAGLSWWKSGEGRFLGKVEAGADGRPRFVQLLTDRASAAAATTSTADRKRLAGAWHKFVGHVLGATQADGSPAPFSRLGLSTGMLPGFASGDVTIEVLGPVDGVDGGLPSLPVFDSDSKSTNGNSVLLRLDHGKARILLTGDLNTSSQKLILDAVGADKLECDVAKACHHGSEDVSISFLKAMHAAATVISSGDGEGHDHPRPRIVAASGLTGFEQMDGDTLVTPLVYSTELARSVTMAEPVSMEVAVPGGVQTTLDAVDLRHAELSARERLAFGSRKHTRWLTNTRVVGRLIYGLVNVRTDGTTILCATMNEGDGSWSVKTFQARF